MFCTVISPFPYSLDGINERFAVEGDNLDLPTTMAKGLADDGLVSLAPSLTQSPENKMLKGAFEGTAPQGGVLATTPIPDGWKDFEDAAILELAKSLTGEPFIDNAVARAMIESIAEKRAELDASGDHPNDSVEIPDDWDDLDWPSLRSLAAQLTEESVTTKDDATAAVDAEIKRRADLES